MSKKELFFLNAPYIDEDGTYEELLNVFLSHPQQDRNILKNACEDISEYIRFCMRITVYYWCNERKCFTQFFQDNETMDRNKWEMRVLGINEYISHETKDFSIYPFRNLAKMIAMFKAEEEHNETNKQNVPYEYLFNELLSGRDFNIFPKEVSHF